MKQSPPTYLPGNSVNSGGPSRPFPRARQAQVCFSCGRRGHYARSCWAKRAHTTVSTTVNESLFVVNKKTCGLNVVSMYFRFPFFPSLDTLRSRFPVNRKPQNVT